ncbi:MAG: methylation-associated defense system protein MAD4 [Anaerolineae bacterium]
MNTDLDLIVLVADADAEWTVRTLLGQRTDSLGIRPLQYEVHRHPGRDPGVFRESPSFLSLYLRRARYSLVLLDREGSGHEHHLSAQQMEADLEKRLQETGWLDDEGKPRTTVIVLEPELETWVWSRSPHVPEALGLTSGELEEVLGRFPTTPEGKPRRPKEALLAALRQSKRPHSARIFQELAKQVSLSSHERSFDKLRTTLQAWFPQREGKGE